MRVIRPDTRYGNAVDILEMGKQEHNPKLAKRLNAIRLLMLGYSWQEVAEVSGVSRQSVHDWVKKWNRNGKEGLISKSGGSKSKVTGEMRAEVTKIIDVKLHTNRGIVTGKLIHGYLKKNTP